VFVVYAGMIAVLAPPVVEQRFDADGATWDLEDLDSSLGGYFAERDPAVGFAADSVMDLGSAPKDGATTEGS
jgi:3-oxoacyl-[acyl-carrier protein] reductase